MKLEVTIFTAAVLGLLLLVLSVRVSQVRMSDKVSLGDAGNENLLTRIRTQANFTEYVPTILVLMGLIEYHTGYSILLGVASFAIILSRLAHAVGMARPAPNPLRVGGTAGTWTTLAVLSVWALIEAIRLQA